jgi:hypothetical protein
MIHLSAFEPPAVTLRVEVSGQVIADDDAVGPVGSTSLLRVACDATMSSAARLSNSSGIPNSITPRSSRLVGALRPGFHPSLDERARLFLRAGSRLPAISGRPSPTDQMIFADMLNERIE